MAAIPAPHDPTVRVAPVEMTVYRLHTTITAYKTEKDSDIHLVLADEAARTMIAEIPSPSCMGSRWETRSSPAPLPPGMPCRMR